MCLIANDSVFLQADSEDSDETARMSSLGAHMRRFITSRCCSFNDSILPSPQPPPYILTNQCCRITLEQLQKNGDLFQICQLLARGRRSELHLCEGCCGTDLCNKEVCSHTNGIVSLIG